MTAELSALTSKDWSRSAERLICNFPPIQKTVKQGLVELILPGKRIYAAGNHADLSLSGMSLMCMASTFSYSSARMAMIHWERSLARSGMA